MTLGLSKICRYMQSEHRLLFSVDLREKTDHAMIWKSDEFISITRMVRFLLKAGRHELFTMSRNNLARATRSPSLICLIHTDSVIQMNIRLISSQSKNVVKIYIKFRLLIKCFTKMYRIGEKALTNIPCA